MLTDFDLSLKCDTQTSMAQLVSDPIQLPGASSSDYSADPPPFTNASCILPNCIVPAVSCFHPKRRRKKKSGHNRGVPEFVSEPVDVRSMSFVGTHEYLAPEIVSGEGHGSAVDWWTLGIFVFELLYGVTPFRGIDNEMTLANIVARALEFPKEPSVPGSAKDLIVGLLVKDPARRMGSTMGAAAIKHHPFFHGVNWALLRCTRPPYVPPPFTCRDISDDSCSDTPVEYYWYREMKNRARTVKIILGFIRKFPTLVWLQPWPSSLINHKWINLELLHYLFSGLGDQNSCVYYLILHGWDLEIWQVGFQPVSIWWSRAAARVGDTWDIEWLTDHGVWGWDEWAQALLWIPDVLLVPSMPHPHALFQSIYLFSFTVCHMEACIHSTLSKNQIFFSLFWYIWTYVLFLGFFSHRLMKKKSCIT